MLKTTYPRSSVGYRPNNLFLAFIILLGSKWPNLIQKSYSYCSRKLTVY